MEPIDQNNLLKSQWIELHQIRILKAHNKHDQNCLQTDLTIIWTIPFNSEISLRIRSRENKALPSHERNPFFDQNYFTVLNRMIDSYTCKAALLWCGDCALEPWDEQSWLDKAFAKPLLINAMVAICRFWSSQHYNHIQNWLSRFWLKEILWLDQNLAFIGNPNVKPKKGISP